MTPTERERYAANDIHQWAGNHKVYFVGTQREIRQTQGGGFFYPGSFKVIASIPLPEPPPQAPPFEGRLPSAQQGGNPRFGRPGGGMFGLDYLHGEKELVIAEWKYPDRRNG
jgi:hypothetical protein